MGIKLKVIVDPNSSYGTRVVNAATGEVIDNIQSLDLNIVAGNKLSTLRLEIFDPDLEVLPRTVTPSQLNREPMRVDWRY